MGTFSNSLRQRTGGWLAVGEVAITFILQVLGGGGAIWGCAEAFGIRDASNALPWRIVCIVVMILCIPRWVRNSVTGTLVPNQRRDEVVVFVLDVLGGAGALWGTAEVLGSRTNYPPSCHSAEAHPGGVGSAWWAPGFGRCVDSYLAWRALTFTGLLWFLTRWLMLDNDADVRTSRAVSDPIAPPPDLALPSSGGSAAVAPAGVGPSAPAVLHLSTAPWSPQAKVLPYERAASSFVLEVCGGAGAVWGASEVVWLRRGWADAHFGQPSFCLWRLVCGPVFLLCLLRWLNKQRILTLDPNKQPRLLVASPSPSPSPSAPSPLPAPDAALSEGPGETKSLLQGDVEEGRAEGASGGRPSIDEANFEQTEQNPLYHSTDTTNS